MLDNRTVLECDDISIIKQGRHIIKGLGICLMSGQLLVLKGSNGSGKTSFIKILAGLSSSYSGTVKFTENGEPKTLQNEVVYLGHDNGCYENITVAKQLAMWGQLYHANEAKDAAMHYFDLWPFSDMKISELSAGWKRRVALSRLLMQQGRVWLLDEPMNNLDTASSRLVQSLIQTRIERGGIVIMSTHGYVFNQRIRELSLNDFAGDYALL